MLLNMEELARDDEIPVEGTDMDVDSADEMESAEELLCVEESKVGILLETSDGATEEAELVTEDDNGVENVEVISDTVESCEDTLDEAIMEEVRPDVNGDNVELVSEDAEEEK